MTVITNLKDYDTLDELLDRKRYWLQLACLWRHVENTLGEEVRNEVRTFGFCAEFLSDAEKAENLAASDAGESLPYTQLTYHNTVRLKNGEVTEMPLFPRPIPAESMMVSIQEKLV